MDTNEIKNDPILKRKMSFTEWMKKQWKPIVSVVVLILVLIGGYLIVAGTGAPKFGKIESVQGGFKEPGLALSWYLNNVLIENFLGVPAILLGTLSFVGYLILKRGFVDSLIGSLKTIIGVLLLSIGSSALTGIASPLFTGIKNVLNSNGASNGVSVIPIDPYLGWSSSLNFLEKGLKGEGYVSWVSYALLIGFAFNLILVACKRFTNCHSVMTTGHIMFQQSAVVVPFVYILFFRNSALVNDQISSSVQAGTIIFSGIFVGTYWSVGTTATIKPTNEITENANFAIGHQQMLGISLAYRLGKFFKFTKGEVVSAENKKMSKKFRIFEDNIFVQSIIIMILFLVLAFILQFAGSGDNKFENIVSSNATWWPKGQIGSFWLIQAIMGSLMAVASILAIVTGVRMFVTELQQSFQGISEKLIPGSVVAVDIAAVYGFSPNSVTYGFISGTIAQFIGVGITIGLSAIPSLDMVVPIPLFITLFFNSGAIGVYANVKGGWKASIVLPAIYGFIEIIVISFALGQLSLAVAKGIDNNTILSESSPISSGYIGMSDWNLFFGFPLIFASMNPIAAYIIMPIEIIAMLVLVQFVDTGLPKEKKTFLVNYIQKHSKKYNSQLNQK